MDTTYKVAGVNSVCICELYVGHTVKKMYAMTKGCMYGAAGHVKEIASFRIVETRWAVCVVLPAEAELNVCKENSNLE
jgi:hypothetical protein